MGKGDRYPLWVVVDEVLRWENVTGAEVHLIRLDTSAPSPEREGSAKRVAFLHLTKVLCKFAAGATVISFLR